MWASVGFRNGLSQTYFLRFLSTCLSWLDISRARFASIFKTSLNFCECLNVFVMMQAVRIIIVLVNSKFLKLYSKAKHRAPAYSRALRHVEGVVQICKVRAQSPVGKERRRISLRMRMLGRRRIWWIKVRIIWWIRVGIIQYSRVRITCLIMVGII